MCGKTLNEVAEIVTVDVSDSLVDSGRRNVAPVKSNKFGSMSHPHQPYKVQD